MTETVKYRITQVRSSIGTTEKQRLNLKSLGLKKIGSFVEVTSTGAVEGLITKVGHLLKVEKI